MTDFDEYTIEDWDDCMFCSCMLCGEMFDLHDGNACGVCKNVYCKNCLEEPFDTCARCK